MSDPKIICLTTARREFYSRHCQHRNIVVDERHNSVECDKCGEKLNPIWVLSRMSIEQSQWWNNLQNMKKQESILEAKQRTKCQHCSKMTKVRT